MIEIWLDADDAIDAVYVLVAVCFFCYVAGCLVTFARYLGVL